MSLRDDIEPLCDAFLAGLQKALGEKLRGIYLYGALTFPETTHTGDIDFHVLLTEALSREEIDSVNALHADLAQRFPPLGAELDGYYLLLAEARGDTPPRHQLRPDLCDDAWALHCAHIRAGRCIVLCGPDPTTIYPEPSTSAIAEALGGELRYVAEHLSKYPDYCVLNLCRLIYSHRTGNVVVSKFGAAAWAIGKIPQWRALIDTALTSYAGNATDEDRNAMIIRVPDFYRFALKHIEQSRSAN